jgi:uncharacterized membrane protein YgaE (UPF0421/DUF939 family)
MNQRACRLRDRILRLDPGLVRFTLMCRTTLSATLVAVWSLPLTLGLNQPITETAPSIVFAMLVAQFARDPDRAAQALTTFLAFAAGAAGVIIAALLAPYQLASQALFVATLACGVLFQNKGQRAVTIAVVSFVGVYIGLFLHPLPAQLPIILTLLVPSWIVLLIVLLLCVPLRPTDIARRTLTAAILQGVRVSDFLRAKGRLSGPSGVAREIELLNEIALTADGQISTACIPHETIARTYLIEIEVAASRAFRSASHSGSATASQCELDRLDRALNDLGTLCETSRTPQQIADGQSTQTTKLPNAPLAWLPAGKAAAAATSACAVGICLSHERWFWAVIGVFVLFLGTTSAADTYHKGVWRVAGTVSGAIAGIALVKLFAGHPIIEVLAMVVCVAGWSYCLFYRYGVAMFFLTVLIGHIYTFLGASPLRVLSLRVGETLIGTATAVLVASIIAPVRVIDLASANRRKLVDGWETTLKLCAARARGDHDVNPLAETRKVDRLVHQLRLTLAPLQAQRRLTQRSDQGDDLRLMIACTHGLRELALGVTLLSKSTDLRAPFVTQLDEIQATARAISRARPGSHGDINREARQQPSVLALESFESALWKVSELLQTERQLRDGPKPTFAANQLHTRSERRL